ncbi:MBL fold metallo-hydrolase [Aureimonas ureilytica]|uniref:MBL fold metallo-hydrolase n=1 Tax=Aureimonas ureilytica TaxID=401562 RepID=UPI00036EF7D2|nr:MBL fold metallo-hydrolase [Aureimonas ureilytica]
MVVQIELGEAARAPERVEAHEVREVRPDLAYLRTILVNVAFVGQPGAGDRGWVLVDCGITGTKGQITEAAASRFGAGARPAAILQTHGHFDHIGALEDFAAEWDAPVFAHALEAPFLTGRESYPPPDTSADGGIMPKLAPLFPRSPVDVSAHLQILPDDGSVPPLPGWRWVHTPGHTPGHVSFFREADRTLIAGDAVISTGQESAYEVATQRLEMHGPPRYFTPDWVAARDSVRRLAALEPELVVTGHGRALAGPAMLKALHHLAAHFDEIAPPRHERA